ncbi:PAS domain S-box-containing protein [Polaromonas sp. CG_9.11]|nr:PAS domain S-box-containing protein [Polaromonas sp. CG_9.11]
MTPSPSKAGTVMLESLRLNPLENSAHFLRRMADVTPGVIEVFDLDPPSTLFVNRCIATLLGYSTEDIQAMGAGFITTLLHPDDLPCFAAHRQRLRTLGDHETADVEYRLRERSGGWRWFESRDAVFARNAAGAVSQVIGNALDISERKHAGEKLRCSEEFHRVSFDLSPVGMAHVDTHGRFTRVNQKYCEITGYPADELLRMQVADLSPPDARAADQARVDLLLCGDLEKYDIEKRYLRKDGAISWVRVMVQWVRDARGQPMHTIGVLQDINARRQTEQALRESEAFSRTVLESSPDSVNVLDREGRRQTMNRNGQHLLEIDDFAALVGQPWWSSKPEPFATLAAGAVQKARRGETARFQAFAPTFKGTPKWWDVMIAPISDKPGDSAAQRLIAVSRDITENTLAEQALREQEARYRSLFDSMQEGYCLVEVLFDAAGKSVDYRHLETNAAFFGHTGVKDAKGRRVREVLPAIEPFWIETIGQVALSGEPASIQNELKSTGRFFDVKAHRIGGPGSRKVGIVFSDISERKRAEAVLAQNVELFSRILEQAPTGMFLVDAGFRLQQVNARAAPFFETTRPLIGRDFAEILEIMWGPVVGAQVTAIFRHTLASGERYVSPPFHEQRLDIGEDQAFDWETQRVTLPDGQHGVVCYFHEITARQRAEQALRDSEEHMRLATEATGVGVWQWNLNTGMVRWDAQMFRIYGITPTADGCVQYADWSGAVLPEDLDTQEETLADTVRRLGSSSLDFRIRRRDDGECRHIHAAETVRKGVEGHAEWMVGTNLDVTERKLAEARIGALLEQLQLADSRKDEFLATLAHELRNPLASVNNSLELMKRASDNTALVEQAHATIARQMGQMVHLIDDLMDVSRITHNRLALRLECVELASMVQHVVEAGRMQCERAGHQLQVSLPPEPITLNADPMRLAQVLGNLLNNACKYTPPGGHIWLNAERQGYEVVLTVRDSGIGIASDMLHQVFELFTQVRSSLDQSQGGLGIGLSLARLLTELHGGTLTAHSQGQGRGSAFVVRLPVWLERAAAPVPISAPPPPVAARRILVVDDMRESADSLAMLLRLDGDETQTAYDGVEAVERAAAFRPDVILLDIGMPKMNGHEACRAIREQPDGQSILIIAMTGWGQEADRRKSLEAGFDHHLVKPLDFAALTKLLALPPKAGTRNSEAKAPTAG